MLIQKYSVRDFFSNVVSSVKDIDYLITALDDVFDKLVDDLYDLENQYNIYSASHQTLGKWEDIYKTQSKNVNDLDFRRFTIGTKFKEKPPFTEKVVRGFLNNLVGVNGYIIKLNYGEYILEIKLHLYNKLKFNEVYDFLNRILPCNLVIDLTVIYNTNEKVSKYKNSYLADMKHLKIKEGMIIYGND
ncbi:MAG: putative phage tail protein [Oscillospiraceae bacterium]